MSRIRTEPTSTLHKPRGRLAGAAAAPAGRLVALAFALILAAPAIVRARAAETADAPVAKSSTEVFEAVYREVERAVAAGEVPASAGSAAEELRFDLEKALIRSDAELEVLKLEAARYQGERRAAALDSLSNAAAARERMIWMEIRRLEGLSGISADLLPSPDPAAAGEAAVEEEAEEPPDEEDKTRRRFNITFQSEDLVDHPDS